MDSDVVRVLWIAIGGGVGSAARYLLSGWAVRVLGPGFPYGTLLVNALGSLLMGALVTLDPPALSATARLALGTGVLGGFTTYSAFNHETILLARGGVWAAAAANVGITVATCLAAGIAGGALIRVAVGR